MPTPRIPDPDVDTHPFISQMAKNSKTRIPVWDSLTSQQRRVAVIVGAVVAVLVVLYYGTGPRLTCPTKPPTQSAESIVAQSSSRFPTNILITGGAGYIGSHMSLLLYQQDKAYNLYIVDDLSRGNHYNIDTLSKLPKKDGWSYQFFHHDCGDADFMAKLMAEKKIDLVIHFAGNAYASESVLKPMIYFDNIVTKTQGLLNAMERAGVDRLVYSSSSATYGQPLDEKCDVPIAENSPQVPVSPYGRSKLMAEQIIDAFAISQDKKGKQFSYALLRYFNVIGADEKKRIGPLPRQDLKQFSRVVDACFDAVIEDKEMSVFGSDYPTRDGTAIRDYIHVWDLVEAHLAVIGATHSNQRLAYNVGIGHGFSNKELTEACSRATDRPVKVVYKPRREGDPALVLGDATKIKSELGWKPHYTDLAEAIRTAWNWRIKADELGYVKQDDESPQASKSL